MSDIEAGMVQGRHIHEVVADLVKLERGGFGTDAVQNYLLRSRIEPASLDPYFTFDESHYTRHLIYRTPCFELLAICWDIGQASPIHDHENERCWARVERGTLRFTNYRLVSEKPLRLEQVGLPVTGTVDYVDALAGIHQVENHTSFRLKAVSLHLYSRPFAECTVYDLANSETRRRRLQYDTEQGF